MMKRHLLPLVLILAGCEPSPPPPQPETVPASGSILGEQVQALEKARDVEQTVGDAAASQRAQIEAASSP